MWELRKKSPLDLWSGRRLVFCLSALVVSLLASLVLLSTPTIAAPDDPAEWVGNTIKYDGDIYSQPVANQKTTIPELEGTPYYISTDSDGSPTGITQPKLKVVYFADGDTQATVESATSASYAVFNYDAPSDSYDSKTNTREITLTTRSDSDQGDENTETNSCQSKTLEGLGWLICPATKVIAKGTDIIFNLVASFLAVQPLQSTADGPIYRAWSMMRSFANVVFVIAFLIIIYSQLTSFGLSNYGLKKLVPRLIAAAILVNISYWICSLAVDVSNVLGYSLQDVFINLREGLLGPGQGNNFEVLTFESLAQFVLSGGAITAGILLSGYAAPELIGGAVILLIPVLIGVLASVIIALIVLAARQAIITILIVISPLAFVAFLLPSTNRYFDKWKDLFLTLLIVFPAFSVVFGGAQLAGAIIIQNANSIFTIIFGMAVQVIPLAITPLLLRLGGGVLNRVAGVINNPKKGLVDRSKNWATEQRQLRNGQNRANPYKNGLFTNASRKGIARKKLREDRLKRYGESDNLAYQQSPAYERMFTAEQNNKKSLDKVHQQHQADYDRGILASPQALQAEIEYKAVVSEAALRKADYDAVFEEAKTGKLVDNNAIAGHTITGSPLSDALENYQRQNRDLGATAMRSTQAQIQQSIEKNKMLEANTEEINGQLIRDYTGGIRGEAGAKSVFTSAIAASRADEDKAVAEYGQLQQHFNVSSPEYFRLAYGYQDANGVWQPPSDVTKHLYDDAGNITASYTFEAKDDYATESAVIQVFKAGSAGEKRKLIMESGINPATGEKGISYKHRKVISQQIAQTGVPTKMQAFGSKAINDVAQGTFYGADSELSGAMFNIVEGKVVEETFATQTPESATAFFKTKDVIESSEDSALKREFQSWSADKQQTFYDRYYSMAKSARDITLREVNRNSDRATLDIFESMGNKYADEIDRAEEREKSEADRRKEQRDK